MSNTRSLPFPQDDIDHRVYVIYNDYYFYETIRTQVTAKPIYTQGEYTVKYVQYSITIHAIVVAGDQLGNKTDVDPGDEISTDVNLEDIRKRLTEPGKSLSFSHLGYGNLRVNSVFGIEDVNYGPKPRILTWEPLGNDRIARIVWTVDTFLPECLEGTPVTEDALAEHSYTESSTLDNRGYLTIKFEGYAEIAAGSFNNNNNNYGDDITGYKNEIIPKVRHRMKRKELTFNVSPDRKSCTFSVVDVAIKSFYEYQDYVSDIKASHSLGSQNALSGKTIGSSWHNTLRVSIKLNSTVFSSYGKSDRQGLYAWSIFLRLLDERFGESLRTVRPGVFADLPIPKNLEIDYDMTEYEYTFTFSWTVVTKFYKDIFKRTNFFSNGVDVATAYANIHDTITPDGPHKFTGTPSFNSRYYDEWVKLCSIKEPDITNTGAHLNGRMVAIGAPAKILTPQCPPEAQSWAHYRNQVKVLGRRQVAINYTLQDPQQNKTAKQSGEAEGKYTKLDPMHEVPTESNVVVQKMGNSISKVVMYGSALKYNSPSTVPELYTFGGRKVELLQEYIDPAILIEEDPCTLWATKWVKVYQVTDFPKDTKMKGKATNNGISTEESNPQDPTQNRNTIDTTGYLS